jgi:DNA-directed RNA polymerase sigma subunit (sigma70/sigma32)
MTKRDDEHQLPMEQRMELFQAVVETQDAGVDTVVTRRRIAKRFGVTERAVRQIEEEGLEGER